VTEAGKIGTTALAAMAAPELLPEMERWGFSCFAHDHMVVFTNVASVDRIIYAIFSRSNQDWKNHTLELFTQAA